MNASSCTPLDIAITVIAFCVAGVFVWAAINIVVSGISDLHWNLKQKKWSAEAERERKKRLQSSSLKEE